MDSYNKVADVFAIKYSLRSRLCLFFYCHGNRQKTYPNIFIHVPVYIPLLSSDLLKRNNSIRWFMRALTCTCWWRVVKLLFKSLWKISIPLVLYESAFLKIWYILYDLICLSKADASLDETITLMLLYTVHITSFQYYFWCIV